MAACGSTPDRSSARTGADPAVAVRHARGAVAAPRAAETTLPIAGSPPSFDQGSRAEGFALKGLPDGWAISGTPRSVTLDGRSATQVLVGTPGRLKGALGDKFASLLIYDADEHIDSLMALAKEVKPQVGSTVVTDAGAGQVLDLKGDEIIPAPEGLPDRHDSEWLARLPDGRYAQLMASGMSADEVQSFVAGLVK